MGLSKDFLEKVLAKTAVSHVLAISSVFFREIDHWVRLFVRKVEVVLVEAKAATRRDRSPTAGQISQRAGRGASGLYVCRDLMLDEQSGNSASLIDAAAFTFEDNTFDAFVFLNQIAECSSDSDDEDAGESYGPRVTIVLEFILRFSILGLDIGHGSQEVVGLDWPVCSEDNVGC